MKPKKLVICKPYSGAGGGQVAMVTEKAKDVGDMHPVLWCGGGTGRHALEALGLRVRTQQCACCQSAGPNDEIPQRRDRASRTPGPAWARIRHTVTTNGCGVARRRQASNIRPKHIPAGRRDRRANRKTGVIEFERLEDTLLEFLLQWMSRHRL